MSCFDILLNLSDVSKVQMGVNVKISSFCGSVCMFARASQNGSDSDLSGTQTCNPLTSYFDLCEVPSRCTSVIIRLKPIRVHGLRNGLNPLARISSQLRRSYPPHVLCAKKVGDPRVQTSLSQPGAIQMFPSAPANAGGS